MSKRSCTACTFIKNGVKTRKRIPHTCGKDDATLRLSKQDAEKFFDAIINPPKKSNDNESV